jgi:hypothetical protein
MITCMEREAVTSTVDVRSTFANGEIRTGQARQVLDYIAWLEHVLWVYSKCDTTTTAIAVFNCFKPTASAKRGREVGLT